MKKIMFLAMLFVSTAAMSQKFQLGVKGGVNISNFTGTFEQATKESLVGLHFGALINFGFGNNISLQPELLFSTQGVTLKDVDGTKSDFKVNYLNIPVLLKYKFAGGFFLETGPQIGFLTSAKESGVTVKEFVKDMDFSWAAGLGFHSNSGFGVDARYNVGLSKVNDISSSTTPDYKNGVIQIGIFYTLFNNAKNK